MGRRLRISDSGSVPENWDMTGSERRLSRGEAARQILIFGYAPLQTGNFVLNIFKHMAVERELHFAVGTFHYIPFQENLHGKFILSPA